MPIRFSTVAANADFLGDDAAPEGAREDLSRSGDAGTAGTDHRAARRAPRESEARPAKDINSAGYVKDKDTSKP